MSIFSGILLTLVLIFLANFIAAQGDSRLRYLFHRFLLIINLTILLPGVLLVIAPELVWEFLLDPAVAPEFVNGPAAGLVFIGMALWGIIATLRPARRFLARYMPLNPDSPVHTLALVLAGYLMGNSLVNMTLGGLESMLETAAPVTIEMVVTSQLLFALIGMLGVGMIVRRNGRALLQRLGLEWPTWGQMRVVLFWIIVLVILQGILGWLWAIINPEEAELVEDVTMLLVEDMDTTWKWFALAASAGLGEEILFRGALQPVLGIPFTALLFAFAHIQYGFTIFFFFIFFIGIILGLLRQRYNTTTVILIHFGYNFILGLLTLIAPEALGS